MKKKVINLTKEEIDTICDSFFECSNGCPLYRKQDGHYRLCMLKELGEQCESLLANKEDLPLSIIKREEANLKEIEKELQIEVEIEYENN